MSRYISVFTDVDVDVDLYDIIDDIVENYNNDEHFRNMINQQMVEFYVTEERLNNFIRKLKMIRKDDFLWNRVKHELKEIVKDDYVVVL